MIFTTIFFDRGYFRKNIPGFPCSFPVSLIPFWGEYVLLDYSFFNTQSDEEYINPEDKIVICRKDFKKEIHPVLTRWGCDSSAVYSLENESDCEEMLAGIKEEIIILYDVNNASLISAKGKKNLYSALSGLGNDEIIKFYIDNTPVDVYAVKKNHFFSIFHKYFGEDSIREEMIDQLFDIEITNLFDRTVNLDGKVFFNNSIMQFYKNNMALLLDEEEILVSDFIASVPSHSQKESVISGKGLVVNSIISSNVKIEGYVENSVIFSDVTIRTGAKISNSVILGGNQIGRDCIVSNSLLLHNFKSIAGSSNIQDNSVIGGNSKKAVNTEYPDQIKNGLTLIGANANIPRNFIVEPGAYLGPDLPSSKIKKHNRIPRNGALE